MIEYKALIAKWMDHPPRLILAEDAIARAYAHMNKAAKFAAFENPKRNSAGTHAQTQRL